MSNLVFSIRGETSDTLEIDVYDDIGDSWWGEGVSAKSVRKALKDAASAKTIKLRVNSRGGDVFDGFAIYNLLRDHAARVEADVDALAASMASVILMAADEIRVAQGSMIMVHNPWSIAMGDAAEMRSTADVLDKIRGQIADAYVARTGQARDRVIEMMDAETWMTAEEAVDNGFADSMKGAGKAKAFASLNLRGLERPPAIFASAIADARASLVRPPTLRSAEAIRATTATSKGVAPPPPSVPPGHPQQRRRNMTLEELRAQHPEAYASAVQAGVTQERDRVCAHITMAEGAGSLELGVAAIRAGDMMTETRRAEYMAAAMNRADRSTRQQETDRAGTVLDRAEPPKEGNEAPDFGAQVLVVMEANRGKKAS